MNRLIQGLHFVTLIFMCTTFVYSQPAKVKWYPQVRTAKDQRTLMLLNAGDAGFQLLRWQDSRTDANGAKTPALPLLTILTPGGERLHDEPLPGFEDGSKDFRFVLANDSVLLVVYEAPNSTGTQSLFARRLNLQTRKWSAAPQVLFSDLSNRTPAFATTWFSRSDDKHRSCVYHMTGGQTPRITIAMLDENLQLLWQRSVNLPEAPGARAMRQVFCGNKGSVLIHYQIFNPGARMQGQPYEATPAVYGANGQSLYRNTEWVVEVEPYSDAILLLNAAQDAPADFYPQLGKKFTPSFEISEGPDGRFYCAGFYSNESPDNAEGYFIYAIDPEKPEGTILKQAPFPGALRKVYLSKKAAANKEAVDGLSLRWLRWAADGRPWLLAERQNFEMSPGRIETATMLRMDSTFRVITTREVEKYQRIQIGDAQNFASLAAIPDEKNGWWLLWNQGNWPNSKLMLTECGSRGTTVDHVVDNTARSNVSLLPQTIIRSGNTWYFVGESEYHERIRIGKLE
ncbi:MAG: hypothetical protein KDD14_18625 [Saprospiraceae bacterium]|nr:hypothetical protein [Saprospiraceae bacterium]